IKQNISLFHVFIDSHNERNILYVTADDTAYGLGANSDGCLGLGHDRAVQLAQQIPQLSLKRIQQFATGATFALALDATNCIYSWGKNEHGQLGRDTLHGSLHALPDKIPWSNLIVQLCCADHHSLALTGNGRVYAWGDNRYGQVGHHTQGTTGCSGKPTAIDFPGGCPAIKYVHCFNTSSFAVTTDGQVFSWGDNQYNRLGHNVSDEIVFTPRLISTLTGVQTVVSGTRLTYFLTSSGFVYFCGFLWQRDGFVGEAVPKRLQTGLAVQDIQQFNGNINYPYFDFVTVLAKGRIYKMTDTNAFVDTNYGNFVDFYANEYLISYNTFPFLNELNAKLNLMPVKLNEAKSSNDEIHRGLNAKVSDKWQLVEQEINDKQLNGTSETQTLIEKQPYVKPKPELNNFKADDNIAKISDKWQLVEKEINEKGLHGASETQTLVEKQPDVSPKPEVKPKPPLKAKPSLQPKPDFNPKPVLKKTVSQPLPTFSANLLPRVVLMYCTVNLVPNHNNCHYNGLTGRLQDLFCFLKHIIIMNSQVVCESCDGLHGQTVMIMCRKCGPICEFCRLLHHKLEAFKEHRLSQLIAVQSPDVTGSQRVSPCPPAQHIDGHSRDTNTATHLSHPLLIDIGPNAPLNASIDLSISGSQRAGNYVTSNWGLTSCTSNHVV
ncbi:unnamed protein product, partial [Medioppia subpectinata]